MNFQTMDQLLRTLTPHELVYKTEKNYCNPFSSYPTTSKNGKTVIRMEVPKRIDIESPFGNTFLLKKTSRFLECPYHIHNWIEINYMYSGECPQTINEDSCILKKGQIILIDTDAPHSTSALGENDIMISLIINKDYLTSNFFNRFSQDSILSSFFINSINQNASHDNYILFHSENSQKIAFFFNELICEMYDPSINSRDILNSLFTLILCELLNIYEKDIERQNLNMNRNSISPILRFIEGNYKNCTLESTAAFFNMNPNYLTTLLKQRTGFSYKELIQRQKMTRSAQLLRNTTNTVTEIANMVGYENMSFFYKKFKEQYGCSPKEYRKSTLNTPYL